MHGEVCEFGRFHARRSRPSRHRGAHWSEGLLRSMSLRPIALACQLSRLFSAGLLGGFLSRRNRSLDVERRFGLVGTHLPRLTDRGGSEAERAGETEQVCLRRLERYSGRKVRNVRSAGLVTTLRNGRLRREARAGAAVVAKPDFTYCRRFRQWPVHISRSLCGFARSSTAVTAVMLDLPPLPGAAFRCRLVH